MSSHKLYIFLKSLRRTIYCRTKTNRGWIGL